jgi:hypothetical protein
MCFAIACQQDGRFHGYNREENATKYILDMHSTVATPAAQARQKPYQATRASCKPQRGESGLFFEQMGVHVEADGDVITSRHDQMFVSRESRSLKML